MPENPAAIRGHIRWEIAGILAVKILGLTMLYAFFFMPSARPVVTAQSAADHLVTLPADTAKGSER